MFARKNASARTAATAGGQVMSEIEGAIEKEKKETEEVIPDDPLSEYFIGAKQILDIRGKKRKIFYNTNSLVTQQ